MAQDNDVIDLRGVPDVDLHVEVGRVTVDNILQLELNDGSFVPDIDLSPIVEAFERGGVVWNATKDYEVGDVVSEGTTIYVALVDNDAALPKQPSTEPTVWLNLYVSEKGGIAYDVATVYTTGDTATVGSIVYVAAGTGVLSNPVLDNGDWVVSAVNEEKGGINWNPLTTYVAGDIVSAPGGIIYVAVNPGILPDPTLGGADWILSEVSAEQGGTNWNPLTTYIPGAVVTTPGGYGYVALGAGVLTDPTLDNGDWTKLIGAVVVEQGGILWDIATNYVVGDIVSYVNGSTGKIATYVSKGTNVGILPTVNGTWREVGKPDVNDFVATALQTVFTIDHDTATLEVFSDGVLIRPTEYTANGTTVVFTDGIDFDTWIRTKSQLD